VKVRPVNCCPGWAIGTLEVETVNVAVQVPFNWLAALAVAKRAGTADAPAATESSDPPRQTTNETAPTRRHGCRRERFLITDLLKKIMFLGPPLLPTEATRGLVA
jgi:hypothetical protein